MAQGKKRGRSGEGDGNPASPKKDNKGLKTFEDFFKFDEAELMDEDGKNLQTKKYTLENEVYDAIKKCTSHERIYKEIFTLIIQKIKDNETESFNQDNLGIKYWEYYGKYRGSLNFSFSTTAKDEINDVEKETKISKYNREKENNNYNKKFLEQLPILEESSGKVIINNSLQNLINKISAQQKNYGNFPGKTEKELLDFLFAEKNCYNQQNIVAKIIETAKIKYNEIGENDTQQKEEFIRQILSATMIPYSGKVDDIDNFFSDVESFLFHKLNTGSSQEEFKNRFLYYPKGIIQSTFDRLKTNLNILESDLIASKTDIDDEQALKLAVLALIEESNKLLTSLPLQLKTSSLGFTPILYTCEYLEEFLPNSNTIQLTLNGIISQNEEKSRMKTNSIEELWGSYLVHIRTKSGRGIKTLQKSPRPTIKLKFTQEGKNISIQFIFPEKDAIYFTPEDSENINELNIPITSGIGKNIKAIDFENLIISYIDQSDNPQQIGQTDTNFRELYKETLTYLKIGKEIDLSFTENKITSENWIAQLDYKEITVQARHYQVYYKIGVTDEKEDNIDANLEGILTWTKFSSGSTFSRTDKLELVDYIWDWEYPNNKLNKEKGKNLGIILGLAEERYLQRLNKEEEGIFKVTGNYFQKYKNGIEEKTDYVLYSYLKVDGKYYIELQLPRVDLNDIDTLGYLFNFRYWRRAEIKFDPNNLNEIDSIQIFKNIEGARYTPNGLSITNKKCNEPGYILVNPPIMISSVRSNPNIKDLNKAGVKLFIKNKDTLKNKGNVNKKNSRSKEPGAVMAPLKGYLKEKNSKNQDFRKHLEKASSATNFMEFCFDYNDPKPARNQWYQLKVAIQDKKDNFVTGQEWCHLRAASLGGEEIWGNLAAGSSNCNSEQLSFEQVLGKQSEGKFILNITDYLFEDNSLEGNYLTRDNKNKNTTIDLDKKIDYIKNAYAINRKKIIPEQYKNFSIVKKKNREKPEKERTIKFSTAKDVTNAPLVAFIRYKIYDNKGKFIIDYLFEGQSELYDKNQASIIVKGLTYLLKGDSKIFDNWLKEEIKKLESQDK